MGGRTHCLSPFHGLQLEPTPLIVLAVDALTRTTATMTQEAQAVGSQRMIVCHVPQLVQVQMPSLAPALPPRCNTGPKLLVQMIAVMTNFLRLVASGEL